MAATGALIAIPMSMNEFTDALEKAVRPLSAELGKVKDEVREIHDTIIEINANVLGENGRLPRLENDVLPELAKEIRGHGERLDSLERSSHTPATCPLDAAVLGKDGLQEKIKDQAKQIDWLKRLAWGLLAIIAFIEWAGHNGFKFWG